MLGNLRYGSRSIGRFLQRASQKGLSTLRDFENTANTLDRISGGTLGEIYKVSPIQGIYQGYKNPLVAGLKALDYGGKGLELIGKSKTFLDEEPMSHGVHNLKQAYEFGKRALEVPVDMDLYNLRK